MGRVFWGLVLTERAREDNFDMKAFPTLVAVLGWDAVQGPGARSPGAMKRRCFAHSVADVMAGN